MAPLVCFITDLASDRWLRFLLNMWPSNMTSFIYAILSKCILIVISIGMLELTNHHLKGVVKWVVTFSLREMQKGYCCRTPIKWCFVNNHFFSLKAGVDGEAPRSLQTLKITSRLPMEWLEWTQVNLPLAKMFFSPLECIEWCVYAICLEVCMQCFTYHACSVSKPTSAHTLQ